MEDKEIHERIEESQLDPGEKCPKCGSPVMINSSGYRWCTNSNCEWCEVYEHEGISLTQKCPICGSPIMINDVGMSWCTSSTCDWQKK